MGGSRKLLRLLAAPAVLVALLLGAQAAQASVAQLEAACSKKDALDDNTGNGSTLPFTFCDDGTPAAGGAKANAGADKAIPVPAAYAGAIGLPAKDGAAAASVPGNSGGDVALDSDLSLPDPAANRMPDGGYPLVVFMHGCCSGDRRGWEATTIDGVGSAEKWHHSNAWFAARGYAVLTYTARGFVDGSGNGSTGEAQLDSSRFEINDYQQLAGQLADEADLDKASAGEQKIDPRKIVPVGGSYGGGFAWMALTDPDWKSPGGKDMRVAAAVPKYGWTNLVESLVPNGSDRRDALPSTDPAQAARPLGFAKRSINAGLYATGVGVIPNSAHTTFPQSITEAQACLNAPDPYESNPLCTNTIANELPRFINERSAYFQNAFFAGLSTGTIAPVPVFSVGTFTDPLFPSAEHRRMAERLKATVPGYPIEEYYGDEQHFTQNKRKEWSDLCGADRHVCTYADYPAAGSGRDLNATPASLTREVGVNTRINRFLDYYVKPPSNPAEPKPANDVTAALQICPGSAADYPADEPGKRFTAARFSALATRSLTVTAGGPAQLLPNVALPNLHALNADPVVNQVRNGNKCPLEDSPGLRASGGLGVATYDSAPLPRDFTLIGQPRVTATHAAAGTPAQLNARLYDLRPDGQQVLVDSAAYRLRAADIAAGKTTFDLTGAAWRFPKGHRVRLELSQDDEPHIKASNVPSLLTLTGVKIDVPVREGSASVPGVSKPSGDRTPAPSRGGKMLVGTRGRDRLVGTAGNDVIICGAGDDYVLGRGGDDYIDCGAGDDRINAGAGRDRVLGRSGDDFIRGASGRDRIAGGSGSDRLGGGSANDRIRGEGGRDRITGNSGFDRILGGAARDRLSGASGNDRIGGGAGNDRLRGGSGRDRLAGGSGRDRLAGGSGRDRLAGGSGRDRLYGSSGNDRLAGGPARDWLFGGPGNDLLDGGPGRDRVSGGPGRDRNVCFSCKGHAAGRG